MTATKLIPTKDESAVRVVLEAVYAAWADNDADAFVVPYATDATAVHSGDRYGRPRRDPCDDSDGV
jgi:hypothetical protein